MILEMTRKKQHKEHLVKVAKADRDWISPEVDTELLKRSSDGSRPIPWEEVKAELDEMDRLESSPLAGAKRMCTRTGATCRTP